MFLNLQTLIYLCINNYGKDIKTIEEVLRLSSKAVRLKHLLVQIPVHVCSFTVRHEQFINPSTNWLAYLYRWVC